MLKIQAGKDFAEKKVIFKQRNGYWWRFMQLRNIDVKLLRNWFLCLFSSRFISCQIRICWKIMFFRWLEVCKFSRTKEKFCAFLSPQCFGLPSELKTGMSTKSDKILSPKFKFLFHVWSKNRLSSPTQDSAKKGVHLTKILLSHL